MRVTSDGLTQATRDGTRRAFLGKASLVAGGAGLAALARAESAYAVPPTLGAFFNVRDYGTGTDRAAIQEAITEAFANGGGIVWFPPGTYTVDDWVVCRRGVTLRGAGSGRSVIKAAPSNLHGVLLGTTVAGSEIADVTVEDLVIDGNRSARQSVTASLIAFAETNDSTVGDNIHVRRCEIRESTGIGCQFTNVRNSSVVDCWVHGCGNAANGGDGVDCFYNCEDILYAGNLIEDTTDEAIGLNAEGFDGSARHGTEPHNLRRITITGNIIVAGSAANSCIGVSGARHVVVDGNVLWQGESVGVGVRNFFDTPGRDVVVSNNVFFESGIGSGTGNAVTITGGAGAVYDDWGSSGCERVWITGNVIVNPRQAAIRLVANPATANGPPSAQKPGSLTDILIQDNVIRYESGATIESSANGLQSVLANAEISNLVVKGNTIRAAKGQGILVVGANHKNVLIADNRVFDSGTGATYNPGGIDITSVEGVVVKDNLSQDTRPAVGDKTQGYGLRLTNPMGNVEITGNDLTGNKVAAATFTGSSGTARLHVRDNFGWEPWKGHQDVSGAFTGETVIGGSTFKYRQVDISYGLAFPTGSLPKVLVTSGSEAYSAAVTNVFSDRFTCRVWLPPVLTPPSSLTTTVRIYWMAESPN